ncbi:MAG: ferrous iron transport protein A [Candidatus Bathyarchaeia archaeon]
MSLTHEKIATKQRRLTKLETPLTHLKDGETAIIVSLNASPRYSHGRHGHKWGFQKRLEDMGLTPGTKITVVKSAPFHGPIELQVRGSRLAIGRGMAERIMVRIEK